MRKMFEVDVFTYLNIINPELFYEKIDFNFDFKDETIYKRNYAKFIKDINKLKIDYPKFFDIGLVNKKSINFTFHFGLFCNEYGIDFEDYKDMVNKNENELPFPVEGYIFAKKKDKTFKCLFRSESFNFSGFFLNYPANDVYLIAYDSNITAEFNLIEDLTKEEKMEYDNYLILWK